ncbi:MAG: hypothetical protein Q9222_007075 [Ikaeria aurantiellina]
MKFTIAFAAVAAIFPLVSAAPAPASFNETAFEAVGELVARNDFTTSTGLSGLQLQTFEGVECKGKGTLHSNVGYNYNYPSEPIKSYRLKRGLKNGERLDFSTTKGGKVRRNWFTDLFKHHNHKDTTPVEQYLIGKRALNPKCAAYTVSAPYNQKGGCWTIHVPAQCFNLHHK